MRCIVHLDVDCFYAQVEALRLGSAANGRPIGVSQRFLLVTCDYAARAKGLRKCMPLKEALRLCPELLVVPGEDLRPYRCVSERIAAALATLGCPIEKLGMDESYLDATELAQNEMNSLTSVTPVECRLGCFPGAHALIAAGAKIAERARAVVLAETGLKCSAGIAHNKTMAKLAGKVKKPDAQTCIFPCDGAAFMASLDSLKPVPGFGAKTIAKLNQLGIHDAVELLSKPASEIQRAFGKDFATRIQELARGCDDSPVVQSRRSPNISVEESFEPLDIAVAEARISELVDRLLILLEEDGRRPSGVAVTCRGTDSRRRSRRADLLLSTLRSRDTLVSFLTDILHKMVGRREGTKLTLIGIAFLKMSEEGNLLKISNTSLEDDDEL